MSKLSNIGITSLISEGVNVCLCTFAGESSRVSKLVVNKIEVSSRTKRNRLELGFLVKCTNTTHLSCFTSFWYKSVLMQVSTVMEVGKKVSGSMNIFSGNSSRKKNLINLLLDDPYIIYMTKDEKVIDVNVISINYPN
jgi:hypothetical protein